MLDEGVRKEVERNRAQVQGGVYPSGQGGRGQTPEAATGKLGEEIGQVRSGDRSASVFR